MCSGNKKGTIEVNIIVFTATLACTKRALFITKGHFWPFESCINAKVEFMDAVIGNLSRQQFDADFHMNCV
jgi:hypothetical protein